MNPIAHLSSSLLGDGSIFRNPVTLKEARSRMRRGRAYLIITIYLTLMSLLVGLIYLAMSSSGGSGVVMNSTLPQTVGKVVFAVVVGFEMMMVCFVAPALTAGAISAERERQTLDLLRTTLLPERSLVVGKLASALFFLLLLLLVGVPLLSLASLFGGIAVEEVLVALLLLAVTALAFSAIGLLISSLIRSTLASTVISYVAAILIVFGEPTLIGIAISFLSMAATLVYSNSLGAFQTQILETLLYAIGYILVMINPLAVAIASEVMLMEKQTLLFTSLPLSSGGNFPIIAPWIAYVLFYSTLSVVLIWLSIRIVRRVEK